MTLPSCPYSPDDQVAFAYGEMEEHRAAAFLQHLSTCEACRESTRELIQAAEVCRRLRETPAAEPVWTRALDIHAVRETKPWWQRSVLWAPAAAMVCGFLVWILWGQPARTPHDTAVPPKDTPEIIVPPTAVARLDVRVAHIEGQVFLRRPGTVASIPVEFDTGILAGDSLGTARGSILELELDDGSRLRLGPGSLLRIDSAGPAGDRVRLNRGAVACRVNPRTRRSFVVASAQADTRVVGTVFAVRQVKAGSLVVGVARGQVELDRSAHGKTGVPVTAGRQVTLSQTGDLLRSEKLGRGMRSIMQSMLPGIDPKKDSTGPTAVLDSAPQPAKDESRSQDSSVSRPEHENDGPDKNDSVAAMVEDLYRDTRWIFDKLREEMDKGRYETVLNRLENYIADPDAPDRSEAVFLKAECLEKMGRIGKAHATYRHYLTLWPAGERAREALAGQIRTRPLR
jgi:ferric-dicitrate binding protein FerR (iron transport regulator)